jgi:hypothetical protein
VNQFPDCFILIFGELAVGGVLCLAVPPFNAIERGFFKSSAGVFLTAALAMVAGKTALVLRAGHLARPGIAIELGTWIGFTAALSLYLYSLWGDRYALRARAYLATVLSGLAALAISASHFRPTPLASLATVLYPLSFFASAATLGTATTGMLLGHWYLIDTDMSLVPLRRLLRAFIIALAAQLVILLLGTVLLAIAPDPGLTGAIGTLWSEHVLLFAARLALGPIAALALAAMIARTLAIPQTMAATGLFYIAVLAIAVGEMLGRLLLLRTSMPL